MKHRMQIMQERWEYDLTMNSCVVYAIDDFIIVKRWQ